MICMLSRMIKIYFSVVFVVLYNWIITSVDIVRELLEVRLN